MTRSTKVVASLSMGERGRRMVARRGARLAAMAALVTGATGAGLLSVAAPAAAITTTSGFTWTGLGAGTGGSDWTTAANWSGGSAPSAIGGSVGTLTFPDLSGESACAPSPPTATCGSGTDNISGLSAAGIDFTAPTGFYSMTGNDPLQLGAGGITVTSGTNPSFDGLGMPLVLDANQTWSVTGPSQLTVGGPVFPASGSSTMPSVTATLSSQATLALSGNTVTGSFTATGSDTADTGNQAGSNGTVLVSEPAATVGGSPRPGSLNPEGHPVAVTDVGLEGPAAIGGLTAAGAALQAGSSSATPGMLSVHGSATLDPTSVLDLAITGAGSGTGTTATAGTDNSALTATGGIDLAGVVLQLATGYFTSGTGPTPTQTQTCITPKVGTTYILASAAGSLTGQVDGPGGTPLGTGAEVPLGFIGGCTNPDESLQLTYHTTATPQTLTGTVVAGFSPPPPPTSTVLYASPNGSATGTCLSSASPCTATQGIVQATKTSGAVTLQLAGGTYTSQLTVAPPVGSPMTSLTITGPTSGSPAVVEPTTLVQNVCEGATRHFFDDNAGPTAAIVGVETGVPYTIDVHTDSCAVTGTGSGASVTVEHLTVSGAGLSGLPPGGELEGIALIDTSGAVTADTVQHIEQPSALGQASVHGIEVKSTDGPARVLVAGNTADSFAGHVAIDLMGGSSGGATATTGTLQATVTGNTLTGDPTTSMASVAQFGIAAGGTTSLQITGNTISGYQSPSDVGAIWLDVQHTGAACTVQGNQLTANDDGVDLRGASGCTVSANTITAGVAGIEAGQSIFSSAASSGNTIEGNTITGTTTVATTTVYNGTSTAPAVAGAPVDGVLVWDGTGNTVQHNAISGFVADGYVGLDPLYLDNTATWSIFPPPGMATLSTAGTTFAPGNALTAPAAAKAKSGVTSYGLAHLNDPTVPAYTLDGTDNWWGCPSGPGQPGCASVSGPVNSKASVDFAPWLTVNPFAPPPQVTPVPPTTPPPPPPPSGATASDSATSTSSTGTATASLGGDTVTGQGSGSLTVSTYAADPVGAPTFGSTGEYFDVQVASGSQFTSVTVSDCNLNGGTSLQWWDGSAWVAVSPQSYSGGPPACVTATLGAGSSPTIAELTGTVFAVAAPAATRHPGLPPTRAAGASQGYWMAGSDGGVFAFGGAGFFGSMGGRALAQPVVGMAATPGGGGYWLVAKDGGIFSFGDAGFHGSLPGLPAGEQPGSPVVAMAATPGGGGYWEVTANGDVYSFGDAGFFGSMGGRPLAQPIVAMAATPDGGGYWLVARDGGVFAFGDAGFHGSVGTLVTSCPAGTASSGAPCPPVPAIVGMAVTADGGGYWLTGANGDLYTFGDAAYDGSASNLALAKPVVGMAATADGHGYWQAAGDGGVFAYGDATYDGSLGNMALNAPIVAVSAT